MILAITIFYFIILLNQVIVSWPWHMRRMVKQARGYENDEEYIWKVGVV
jgi:hypothetical protein